MLAGRHAHSADLDSDWIPTHDQVQHAREAGPADGGAPGRDSLAGLRLGLTAISACYISYRPYAGAAPRAALIDL
jgi:hypothetical protein